jgi:hypothetical protein
MVIYNDNGIFFVLLFGCWLNLVLQGNVDVKYMALGQCELCLVVEDNWFCFIILKELSLWWGLVEISNKKF